VLADTFKAGIWQNLKNFNQEFKCASAYIHADNL